MLNQTFHTLQSVSVSCRRQLRHDQLLLLLLEMTFVHLMFHLCKVSQLMKRWDQKQSCDTWKVPTTVGVELRFSGGKGVEEEFESLHFVIDMLSEHSFTSLIWTCNHEIKCHIRVCVCVCAPELTDWAFGRVSRLYLRVCFPSFYAQLSHRWINWFDLCWLWVFFLLSRAADIGVQVAASFFLLFYFFFFSFCFDPLIDFPISPPEWVKHRQGLKQIEFSHCCQTK